MKIFNKLVPRLKPPKPVRQLLYVVGGSGVSLFLLLISYIYIRLAIAYHQAPVPQGILVLGGGSGREEFAAELAKAHPSLKIVVSSPRPPGKPEVFQAAGIPKEQVEYNWYAVDTVGNFAYTLGAFQSEKIQHIYVITSDYHMPRAKVIATIILGSQGITFTPVSVATNSPSESRFWLQVARDSFRSIFWIVTGRTGANFTKMFRN
ncbi:MULTISPECIES: YdcF family protein [unclassified Coleofasciculus]|uniref:YdcF family protein n=1 Tax=unclassified Coleofasciculus TaxID=2692782 RepID=UPI002AD3CCDB|nr:MULTISPECIES: YdcF family protein [unclassified Coleofasciculus]